LLSFPRKRESRLPVSLYFLDALDAR
jgi:hypothetical protein